MKNVKLAIFDSDEAYVFGLMEYINSDSTVPFMAMGFTSKEHFLEFVQEKKADLYLVSQEEHLTLQEDNVIYLTQGEKRQENSVYKYQRVDNLLKDLTQFVGEEFYFNNSQATVKICGVYSPLGRVGKTNLALGLCQYSEEKSLYISLEEYGGDWQAENGDEFLYLMKKRDEAIVSKLSSVTAMVNGVEQIKAPSSLLDLRDITTLEWENVFRQLRKSGMYGQIVLDMGIGSFNDYSFFELLDVVYMPMLENGEGEQKVQRFRDTLERVGEREVLDKLVPLRVPNCSYEHPNMKEFIKAYGL